MFSSFPAVYSSCLLATHNLTKAGLDTDSNPVFYINVADIPYIASLNCYIACEFWHLTSSRLSSGCEEWSLGARVLRLHDFDFGAKSFIFIVIFGRSQSVYFAEVQEKLPVCECSCGMACML